MADETEISTPVETSDVTTSTDTPEVSETAEVEVTDDTKTAETETNELKPEDYSEKQPEEKLYAGKYKSIEELEKGYQEAQKTLTQNLQIKAKYDELLKKQEQQEARLLQKAQEQGYNTINDQQIAQQVAQAELNEFVNALRTVEPDAQLQVQQYLNDYYQTGDIRYLNEAKRYYPSDFLERVAVGKLQMQNNLKAQFEKETREKAQQADAELAQTLRTDYSDFIETVKGNESMSKALEMFCNAGFIQSKDDMEVFKGIIDGITASVKDQAIKEYEAKKVIDATKQKASIQADSGNMESNADYGMPTGEQLRNNPSLYAKAVKKYGMDKVDAEIMKG